MEPNNKSKFQDSFEDYSTHCVSSGGTSNDYPASGRLSLELLESEGWKTPNFYQRLNAGELLPYNPWIQFSENAKVRTSFDYQYTSGTHCWGDSYPYLKDTFRVSRGTLVLALNSYDATQLTQESAAKIYQNGSDALTFLAELHKVKSLIGNALNTLISILRNPANWANQWLQIRYGWRILLYELEEIDQLLESLGNHTTYARYKESTGSSDAFQELSIIDVAESSYVKKMASVVDSYSISTRGSVVADVRVPRLQFNAVQTAWELQRYSFVVDWVLDLGQWISALSFFGMQEKHVAAHGYQVDLTRNLMGVIVNKTGMDSSSFDLDASLKYSLTVRTPASVSKLPQFKLDLGVAKIIDLVALGSKLARK